VRVMGTRVIVQWVLDELKTRETYRVEREMVSSLRAAVGEGGDAEIPERRHPRLEDRSHHSITLEIDPADPSRAVIQVEVAGELRMLRLGLHRHRVGEVLADVAPGAEQALLLAAPERDAHRARERKLEGLEDAESLEGDRAAGAVVGCTRSAVPAVEVGAQHHHLVALLGAG